MKRRKIFLKPTQLDYSKNLDSDASHGFESENHFVLSTNKFEGGITMETTIFVRHRKMASFYVALLLSAVMYSGCAHHTPQPRVSQYRFNFENQSYRIRSISSTDKSESYNELIGEKFMAADYDQDRIIDCILLGEVSLIAAQRIYEYGLTELTKENKLKVKNPSVNRYVYVNNNIQLEIRSYRPTNAQPFNEFKITDQRPVVFPDINIIIDQNADGILDEVLKGSVNLENAQAQYTQAIEVGLQKGELIKVNGTILVKEK